MSNNTNLHRAKNTKNDEFYTRIEDIEKELKYYKDFFKDKVVYCNCDRADGENRSNFFVYFAENFKEFGLKRLICTSYNKGGKGKLFIYDGDTNLNDIIDMDGDGDFRSEECVKWLEKCDVVVTNPPFSLFRDFVAQLVKYDKKFLIIGNMNAITYKEIFPLIKDGKIWLGRTLFTGKMPFFKVPNDYDINNSRFEVREDGIYKQVNAVCWFTNIYNQTNKEVLDVYCKYNEADYPKYDNYDAINCDVFAKLPMDYDGVIGVPITSLKYLWDDGTLHVEINGVTTQFEIVGIHGNCYDYTKPEKSLTINGKKVYKRIMIRKIKS